MNGDLVIHRLNTGWLYSEDAVSLLGGGRRPDVPTGRILPYGWQPSIRQPDGREMPGTMVPAPAWLIRGGGATILVDSGTGTVDQLRDLQRDAGSCWTFEVTAERHILALLQHLGVAADDVDIVVQTHLHFDHVGATALFERARVVVHAAELPWALNPPPFLHGFYAPSYAHQLLDARDRLSIVHGDTEIAPGVRMVHTGGHSPGHCMVLVETAVGRVAIAGDAVYNYRNLEYRHPQGPFTDLAAVMRSMDRLREADVVALNHDALFDRLFPTETIGDAPLQPRTTAYMRRLRDLRSGGGGDDMLKEPT